MTNHEAIETLRANYPDACFEQLREAVDMAINVLTAQEQKERDCSTCKHKNLCDAFWTQEIEDAPCRECDELTYQKWEPQEITNNSQKLDSENDEHLATILQPTCNTHNVLNALDCSKPTYEEVCLYCERQNLSLIDSGLLRQLYDSRNMAERREDDEVGS